MVSIIAICVHYVGNGVESLCQPCKDIAVIDNHKNTSHGVPGYTKPVYSILVANSIKVYPTNLFASLPQHDKFLVKERQHDPATGLTKARLILKSSLTEAEQNTRYVTLL